MPRGKKVNVYVPASLLARVEAQKGRLNVSEVCQQALAAACGRLEREDLAMPEWLREQ